MSLRGRLASPPLLCSLYPALLVAQQSPGRNIPHLEQRGTIAHLIVDGKPFLILGAELYNNSATSPDYFIPRADKMIGHKPPH